MSNRPIAFEDPERFKLFCHHSPAVFYPEETHDTVQVCVPCEGASYRVIRQSETGGKIVHTLGAKDILVVPVLQQHTVDWRRSAAIVSINMSERFLGEALGIGSLRLRDTLVLRDPFLTGAARQLQSVLVGDNAPPAIIDAFVTLIAYRVGKQAVDGAGIPVPSVITAFSPIEAAKIRDYIWDHLDKPIPLAELAAEADLSLWHFMRKFYATEGLAPHAYITRCRMQRGENLVATTQLPIIQIALEVGMSHSHFSRTFFATYGVSPRDRRRLRSS
jgi:AraC-like DNA-binding protein